MKLEEGTATVTATNPEINVTRDFTKSQWDMLGEKKEGFKVVNPGEAEAQAASAERLATARHDYTAVTGQLAPASMDAASLEALTASLRQFKQQAPAPVLPLVGQPQGTEAIDYKRPRSTETAREIYAKLFNREADADASFTQLVTEIETALNVAASGE